MSRLQATRPPFAAALGSVAAGVLLLAAANAQAASPERGAGLFKQRCAMCHRIDGGKAIMGPDLKGVVGRSAGSAGGYAFSQQMRAAGFAWAPAKLDAFLAKPGDLVKGTRMMTMVNNPADRADIIAYLETVR